MDSFFFPQITVDPPHPSAARVAEILRQCGPAWTLGMLFQLHSPGEAWLRWGDRPVAEVDQNAHHPSNWLYILVMRSSNGQMSTVAFRRKYLDSCPNLVESGLEAAGSGGEIPIPPEIA